MHELGKDHDAADDVGCWVWGVGSFVSRNVAANMYLTRRMVVSSHSVCNQCLHLYSFHRATC